MATCGWLRTEGSSHTAWPEAVRAGLGVEAQRQIARKTCLMEKSLSDEAAGLETGRLSKEEFEKTRLGSSSS